MLNLILLLVLAFCEIAFAKTTNQPNLLWKKEFKTEINSVAISKDGKRIAVIAEPNIKKYKDERYYDESEEEHKKGMRREWFGSKLYYLDNKGKILWQYEAKKMHKLNNVAMSDNGEYIACSLMEFITEDREIGYPEGDKIKKWQEPYYGKFLFFNSKGKLLWSFKGAIRECQILSDGNYIFLIPGADESSQPDDDFYFLNKEGKMLWKVSARKYIPSTKFLQPISTYKMTKDANRIIIGNTLYDKKGNILWRLKEGIFTELTEDGSFGIVEIPIYPYELERNYWKTFLVVDLNKKKVLWKINVEKIENPPYGPRYIRPFTEYFIDESKKYLLGGVNTRGFAESIANKLRLEGEGRIYDLKTGKLIKKLTPSEIDNYKEWYQNQGRKYRVENNKNILNYYSLEVVK